MRLLITRADVDAGPTVSRLVTDGHQVVREPLLKIKKGPDADAPAATFLAGAQALIATSANGVRAIGLWHAAKGMPFYCVGAGTAQVAQSLGFSKVISADGDVHRLVDLIAEKCQPNGGPLVHLAGKNRAGDLKGDLEAKGFEVRRAVLYHAKRSTELGNVARQAIDQQGLDGVLLFSPRTASIFLDLVAKAGLTDKLNSLTAYVLSNNVAKELADAGLKDIKIAAEPTLESLLALIPAPDKKANAAMKVTQIERPIVPPVAEPPRKGRVYPAQSKTEQATPPTQNGPNETAPLQGDAAMTDASKKTEPKKAQAQSAKQTKSTPPKAQPKAKQNKSGKVGWYLAGALGLMIAGNALTLYTLPQWPDSIKTAMGLSASGDPQQIAALESRIADLDARLTRLQAAQSGKADQASTAQRLSTLAEQIAALQAAPSGNQDAEAPAQSPAQSPALANNADIEALQTELAELQSVQQAMLEEMAKPRSATLSAEDQAKLTAFDARITALAAQTQQALTQSQSALDKSGTANARLLAFAAVERAAQSGNPFATEWAAADPLLSDLDAATRNELTALARAGVASQSTLTAQYDALIGEALRIANMPEEASWWQRLWAQLTSIVTVRRIGGDDGASAASRLARAEAALDAGDLGKALADLDGLEGATADWLAPWLEQAKQRHWLDTTLHSLRLSLLNTEG